jgi:hypothetical protein
MTSLTVEDRIAADLAAFFENDDVEPEEYAILAAAMPLGPAPTMQIRLFEAMTASPRSGFS